MAIEQSILENLTTIAEVSVTMAGFALVAGAIDRSRQTDSSVVASSAFVSLFTTAVPLIILSLLPGWLNQVFDSSSTVWRVCLAVFVVEQIGAFVLYFATGTISQSTSRRTTRLLRIMSTIELAFIPVGIGLTIAAAVCVLGYFETWYAPLYHGCLLFMLLLACIGFGMLLVVRDADSEDGS